jgi:TetR/AcrR family fatty acid metabolism transcriptional regulator
MMEYKDKELLIYDALTRLGRNESFLSLKISDIAKEAGIGKGTVYEYFSSKEEIIERYLDYCAESYFSRILEVMSKDINPVDKLRLIVQVEYEFTLEQSKRAQFMSGEMVGIYGQKEKLKEHMIRRFMYFYGIIEEIVGKEDKENNINTTMMLMSTMTSTYVASLDNDEINVDSMFTFLINKLK